MQGLDRSGIKALRFAPRKTYRSYHGKIAKTDALLLEIKISINEFHFQNYRYTHKAQLMQMLAFSLSRIKNERFFSYILSTEWKF